MFPPAVNAVFLPSVTSPPKLCESEVEIFEQLIVEGPVTVSEVSGVSPPIFAPKLVPEVVVVTRARAAPPFIVEFESKVIELAVSV